MDDIERQEPVLPPTIAILKNEAAQEGAARQPMERSFSQDIREEREDLKEAAEHSLNVILDLNLDGVVKWVSPSWEEIIGTPTAEVTGKPIADILLDNKDAFTEAVESLQKDDSRSIIVRFSTNVGKMSILSPKTKESADALEGEAETKEKESDEDGRRHTIDLEAQGIVVYDRTSGEISHTMWMIRPAVVRQITIDLPELLVESLGVGSEMLAQYLTGLAEVGANDPANHPPPMPVLCRICERQITPWWFEKHTDLCLQEHKAEMEVQIAHEHLSDHRNDIVKVLDALEARSRQARPTSGETAPSPAPLPEYKGVQVGPVSTPSSGPSSGRASPASPPSRSRDRSTSGFGHHRARSFAIRRPVARIIELVLDLCDTAIEINTPALKETPGAAGEFRTQSPGSENRITQVLQWQSPTSGTVEADPGLTLLCDDTARFARQKVEAVFRHRRILEYSERIRIEFDVLVHECIDAAIRKAARIAAGDLTDSSTDTEGAGQDEGYADETDDAAIPEQLLPEPASAIPQVPSDGLSSMATALRNAPNPDFTAETGRRKSSTPASTRSSSPRGAQTPKSHGGIVSVVPQSKRASICLESDTGAESDSSMRSSVFSAGGARRADSPGAEVALSRVSSTRERKRRSLILPSAMSSRGQSPARVIPPPSSPLRLAKGRVPSGTESVHSPVTSPVLSTSEFSSPGPSVAHLHHHHHRRQSSAASSDVLRPPGSPRLAATNPQPRAVPPSIKDFEIIKPISKGAFGSVYLSKKKSTGDYFAIKVLKKADMVAKNQVTNVKAERAIMMWQGESDFVAKLYWTFSSKDFLYLVMEYLNGGDCASLIKILGGLPEDWAKKYIGEVILGVEHLHSRGIVHRDLKPDNLLIDAKGHLKLTDFGLSRMGVIGRQKRALNNKASEPIPDLLQQGPFKRAISVSSSRSASFDIHPGNNQSPSHTPSLTPALTGELGQPSYFNLYREPSQTRKTSGHRSDSESSEALQSMFRRFSLAEDPPQQGRGSPIEEESSGENHSPDPYALQPVLSHVSIGGQSSTPPATSTMPPPPMALFDPQDTSRKFVGTPDYLAPETVSGVGQDETSDWWSLGCILFEFLFGYPPFHANTPEDVFENILARKIDWPDENAVEVSAEAKDLINRLICSDPAKRLGANAEDKFPSGGEEIKNHPWFADINWTTLLEDQASFVPNIENPEDTEYFDTRGATLENFSAEFEDQGTSSAGTPGAEYPERPHDALSRVRTQVNSMKRGLMPLHIPPHVRDGRSRRLSEPVPTDDFGSFSFKNLPVLEKANKDVIQKLRAEALQAQSKSNSGLSSPAISSPTPSLESSPVLPMPLKRTLSTKSGASNRPVSPLLTNTQASSSPNKASQPSSPLLVSFSAGPQHERRKTSGSSSSLSAQNSNTLQPGSFFDAPKLSTSFKTTSTASSPIKLAKSPGVPVHIAQDRTLALQKQHSAPPTQAPPSARPRSQTISSQEEDIVTDLVSSHHKRRSQALDLSPSSSDNEDTRQKALLRVQRRRQSSRRLSQIFVADGPFFRPLDVLICEDHPVSRIVMEKLLEKLRCRTITVCTGSEAVRVAMGDVKFDLIMMEIKLPQINGADVARMVRDTKNSNARTPIVAVTGYLKELQAPQYFDGMIEKPPTLQKLTDVISRLCQWKPPPPDWTPGQLPALMPSGLRQESLRSEDSPTSNSSSFPTIPSSSWRGSSREDSISSSFFGDVDSRSDDVALGISRQGTDEWRDQQMARAIGGLGISEDPPTLTELETKSLPAEFIHQSSAPAQLEHIYPLPKNRRSGEPLNAKRKSLDLRVAHEWADSGDDEDEELGDAMLRAKSPKGRPRGSSKLGVEMMRTNSHGSVVSVEDIAAATHELPHSPPPVIAEAPAEERLAAEKSEGATLTPPEVFPRVPGDGVEVVDMEATPRASGERKGSPDIDDGPTPKPAGSPEKMPHPEPEGEALTVDVELANSPPNSPDEVK